MNFCFQKVKDYKLKIFKKIWKIYTEAFPSDEKRSLKEQIKLFLNPNYILYSIEIGKEVAGLLGIWKFQEFVFIEHLAVRKDLRGQGIGTRILKNFLKGESQNIILEVERPRNKISKKRIKFFKKCGFKLNRYNYIQPPYDKNKKPVPMYLISFPDFIKKREYDTIKTTLYKEVYNVSL